MALTLHLPEATSLSEPPAFLPAQRRRAMARVLLDRALADFRRAEAHTQGSMAEPLYRPEVRWDMVQAARQLLDEMSQDADA